MPEKAPVPLPDDDARADDVVSRIAAVDDYIAGMADRDVLEQASTADIDSGEFSGLVDLVLLLRQSAAASGVVPSLRSTVPRSIGRYEVLARAGEGGFATVWVAHDPVLRRRVALKVRRPEWLFSTAMRRRFVREAEIASRLVHPCIVTIYEVGVEDGREFIAQEFCAGGSLASWLLRQPGPLDARNAARLVLALARAVAYSHGEGVIHRDIKPGNVLLVPLANGDHGLPHLPGHPGEGVTGFTVKLADFGLGKVQDDDSAALLTQLTRTGASLGTPAWMAPEQIDPGFGPVGPATDVYALGLLLDRLLTGRVLRDGRTTAETYRQALFEDPPSPDRVMPGVPRDLGAVCLTCLARRQGDRYESATALADDLERWLDGRPTRARPLSPVARATRQAARRPGVTALLTATLAVGLLAGWAWREQSRASHRALDRQRQLSSREAVAELQKGCEALQTGNVGAALAHLRATRAIDAGLADSLAGRWLERRSHEEQATLLSAGDGPARDGPPRDLYSITLSPDGRTAALAGADGQLRLLDGLDRADGRPRATAIAAHDEINDVCFSADGTRLATVGQDGRLRWWERTPEGLAMQGEWYPAAGPLYAVAFSSDGRSLIVGGEDRSIRVVPLTAQADARRLFAFVPPPGGSPEVESIVALAGERLAACCGHVIVVLDEVTGASVREFERPTDLSRNAVLGSLTVSRDGTRLMACGTDARAHVWDIATGKLLLSLPAHPAWVQGCSFSPDGTRVATGCRDGGIRFFTADSGTPCGRLVGHLGRVWSVAFEASGSLLSAGADGTVRRWDPKMTREAAVLREIALPWSSPTVRQLDGGSGSEGGKTILALSSGGEVAVVDVAGGQANSAQVSADDRQITHLATDAARDRLALACRGTGASGESGSIEITNRSAGTIEPGGAVSLPGGQGRHGTVSCWMPTGELVVATDSGALFVCSPDLQRVVPVRTLADPIQELVPSPDGSPRLAVAGKQTVILTLQAGWGKTARALPLEIGEEACRIAWSPDGTVVAVGTRSGHVLSFEASTGAARGSLAAHERRIAGLAFSADGRVLVSADAGCVRISDTGTLATFDELRPGWQVTAIQLRNDALVIAGGDGEQVPMARARLAVMDLKCP